MAERFTSRARDTSGDEALCVRDQCGHARHHHQRPGLCTGLGDEKSMLGSFCSCIGFKGPESSGKPRYSTYVPPIQPGRTGFTETSSRREIGGQGVARPNLQYEKTVEGAAPEWAMFGVKLPDGNVAVYASTALSYLTLRQEAGHFDEVNAALVREGKIAPTPWDIRGRMVDYVRVVAPTYNEAIRALFLRGWRPDGEPTTEDLQRQAALEEARREAELPQEPRRALGGTVDTPEPEIYDAEIVEDLT